MNMIQNILRCGVSLAVMMVLTACSLSAFDETGRTFSGIYTDYFNPPANIDYEDDGSLNASERFFIEQLMALTAVLDALVRDLQSADGPPSPARVEYLLKEMPWLSGVIALDVEGLVLAQEPPMPLKQIDFTQVLTTKGRGGATRTMQAFVVENVLGPEIVATMPIYFDGIKRGFFGVHFNIQTLVSGVPARSKLLVFTPKTLLWEGLLAGDVQAIREHDWENIVKSAVQGEIEGASGTYFWMSYFLGDVPLIFLLPIENEKLPPTAE